MSHVIVRVFFAFAVILCDSHCLKPHSSKHFRFMQVAEKTSRGFFDSYDRSDETLFDASIFGFCSTFKPPFKRSLGSDWVAAPGWSYHGDDTITYQGEGESHDSPFWLWFWKRERTWTKFALMKNDHFCRNSEITAEVQLNGAKEAGIVFRARGTWDFWALLLGEKTVTLVWFYEGRRKELKTCDGPRGVWTVLHVSDQIADLSISCGAGSTLRTVERAMGDVEEIADNHMGAAGLVAFGGGAQFRNVFLGPVDWSPDTGAVPKLKAHARAIATPSADAVVKRLSKSDLTDVAPELLRWCPDPSLCGQPPYRISQRPNVNQ